MQCRSFTSLGLRASAGLLLSVLVSTDVPAQAASPTEPLANASIDQLRDLLSASTTSETRSLTRSFTRTQPPSTDGVCPGAGATATAAQAGSATRKLVVVPLAADTAPQVNLAIQFASGSDSVAAISRPMLDRLAALLQEPAMADARFAIAGHTDATGNPAGNLELSCARAISARKYLLTRGVKPERLSAYGFGSSKPIESDTEASAKNRRVEVRRAD